MRLASSLIFALLVAAPAAAQDYRPEQSDKLRIRYMVHDKLQPVPLKLGQTPPHLVAKYEPKGDGDYIWGRYGAFPWYLHVLEFPKNKGVDASGSKTEGGTTTASEPEVKDKRVAANFREWVTEKDTDIQERKFITKGKEQRGRRGTPDYEMWEYTDSPQMTNGRQTFKQLYYKMAAVYDFPERQVALVVQMPVKRGTRPDRKYLRWMTAMTATLRVLEADDIAEEEFNERRDEFADTPEKMKELEKAKANIQNVKGWDYFTSPNYIILYSWDPEKPEKQRDAYKFAFKLVQLQEEMFKLYQEHFPPHEKMLDLYSVLRICDTEQEFHKYSENTRPGVVGWFSPGTKELVVFAGRGYYVDFQEDDVISTTHHEGWHQYANRYFVNVELQRWIDEGLGDYFGAHKWTGRGWKYETDRGRYMSIRQQIARETFISLREIVTWNKDKFYGPRAPDHYAQGYSLVDFLRRGEQRLGRRFRDEWSSVIDVYRKTLLETKDQKKAVEMAFEGIDWDELEHAWIEWVRRYMK